MAHPPRTGNQKALYITSVIMIVFGILVTISGIVIIAAGASAGPLGIDEPLNVGGTDTTAGLVTTVVGSLVVVLGLIELVVAVLGIRGANDASKIGPYRALSWGISIVLFAMFIYTWVNHGSIFRDPFLFIGDIIYLIFCTTLADQVKRDRDRGIVGEPEAERSGSQKALRVIVIVLIVFAIVTLLVSAAMMALAVFSMANGIGIDYTVDLNGQSVSSLVLVMSFAIVLIISSVIDLVVGIFGLRGANDPRKIKPFFVLCIISLALCVIGIGWSLAQGTFASSGSSDVVELLITGVCTWLSYDIMRKRPALDPAGAGKAS